MGLMATESKRETAKREGRRRARNSKRLNTQPKTYPGKTITSGKRKNARVVPKIS
jgi:hypothetical protein